MGLHIHYGMLFCGGPTMWKGVGVCRWVTPSLLQSSTKCGAEEVGVEAFLLSRSCRSRHSASQLVLMNHKKKKRKKSAWLLKGKAKFLWKAAPLPCIPVLRLSFLSKLECALMPTLVCAYVSFLCAVVCLYKNYRCCVSGRLLTGHYKLPHYIW